MSNYRLVVCEKPSVAKSIAAVLDAKKREDGYLFGNGFIVSWCFGHLAELADADAYDEKYGKWRREDLPILPEAWQYTVARDKKKRHKGRKRHQDHCADAIQKEDRAGKARPGYPSPHKGRKRECRHGGKDGTDSHVQAGGGVRCEADRRKAPAAACGKPHRGCAELRGIHGGAEALRAGSHRL